MRLNICTPFWFFIAALLVTVHPGKAQTWVQWKTADGGNDHYYAVTSVATNWDAAQKLAVSWGGTLATITSSNEQNFINTNFLTGKFEYLPLWIGLRNVGSKGGFNLGSLQVQFRQAKDHFRWVTGEPFSYKNWKSGEPSGIACEEDYVAINWEYSDVPPRGVKGGWNDTPENGTSSYGGATSGPYFGLVERDSDPSKAGGNWYAGVVGGVVSLAFVSVFLLMCAVAVIFYFVRRYTRR